MMYLLITLITLAAIIVILALFDRQLFVRLLALVTKVHPALLPSKYRRSAKFYKFNKRSADNKLAPAPALTNPSVRPDKRRIATRFKPLRLSLVPVVSLLLIALTAGGCYLLFQHGSLEVYHSQEAPITASNSQVAQLLAGERLSPPPAPPEALFAELDAEIASYQATQVPQDYWPETTVDATKVDPPLIAAEPDLSTLNAQDTTSGFSGDLLASHVHNNQINIRNADRNWNKMNSEFTQRLLTVYKVMRDQYGYELVLLEGYRSPERQARLLRKGSHVTKAGSYKSYHQFGLAADTAFIKNGKIIISEKDPWAMRGYQLYGKVAKSAGLVWGGDWRMQDLGHVELRKKGVLGRPEMARILTSQ